jgi:hypothetical protein
MSGRRLDARIKRTSALRRVVLPRALSVVRAPGLEGDVCAFQLNKQSSPIAVEGVSGRMMTLVPGELFLATPGHQETDRMLVGGVPARGLVPGAGYWLLAECGVVGGLVSSTPPAKSSLGHVRYIGAVAGDDGKTITMRQFAEPAPPIVANPRATVLLIVGTAAEVGKTTAGIFLLRGLRRNGYEKVVVLKATGTSGVTELAAYQDHGAMHAFDCVDFGLPTTYPSKRKSIGRVFDRALDTCFSRSADVVLIECGGDMLAANIPMFLARLKRRRARLKVVLAASDAVGAFGATRKLREMGLSVDLITGPCTDTSAVRLRTQALCGTPCVNFAWDESQGQLPW